MFLLNNKKIILIIFVYLFFVSVSIVGVSATETDIYGKIFFDKNNNGKFDSDEEGVKGVYVKIYDSTGERIRDSKTGEAISTVSDENGKFTFKSIDSIKEIKIRKPDNAEKFVFEGKEYSEYELVLSTANTRNFIIGIKGGNNLAGLSENNKTFIESIELEPIITTLKTASVGIIFTFIIGILLVRLTRAIKNKALRIILDVLFTLPLVLPPTVIGFFLLRLCGINSFIGRFFLNVFDFRIVFSWESTVLAAVALSLPLMYRSTFGALEQVDKNLIYAARTLGFSERKIFWKILLPNAIPGIASATILSFARGMGEYGATSMIAGNILGETRTIPIAVAVNTAAGQDDLASFYVIVIMIIAFILITLMNVITYKASTGRKK